MTNPTHTVTFIILRDKDGQPVISARDLDSIIDNAVRDIPGAQRQQPDTHGLDRIHGDVDLDDAKITHEINIKITRPDGSAPVLTEQDLNSICQQTIAKIEEDRRMQGAIYRLLDRAARDERCLALHDLRNRARILDKQGRMKVDAIISQNLIDRFDQLRGELDGEPT